jgi:hypothetical protein
MELIQNGNAPNTATTPVSGIRDNYLRGAVGEFLLDKIREGADLSIVSAYFTIYAFGALQSRLATIDRMRFLFGEPRFIQSLDPERTDKKAFKIEDEGLQLANRLEQKRLARECAEWMTKKAEIRSVRQASLMHGKMYHISRNGIDDAIMGSSNFTVHGLGLGPVNNNIELNLEVDSNRDRRDLKAWFEEIWNNLELVEDVKPDVLSYLEQLYVNHPPEFIYFKTLYHVFERFLAAQHEGGLLFENTQIVETEIWRTLFEFQKDAVKGAINKINAHNGCIIADSVGLGKTFEALAIIKYYELRNSRVLVLCPKKVRENWTIYQAQNNSELNLFIRDRFSFTVLSHTDLSRDSGKPRCRVGWRSNSHPTSSNRWRRPELTITASVSTRGLWNRFTCAWSIGLWNEPNWNECVRRCVFPETLMSPRSAGVLITIHSSIASSHAGHGGSISFGMNTFSTLRKQSLSKPRSSATPLTSLRNLGAWTAFLPCTPGSPRTTFGGTVIMQPSVSGFWGA